VNWIVTARAWRDQDPDAETRDELDAILAKAESGEPAALLDLESRFGSRLTFGTAGLRGQLGAGSNRMNRVLVAQTAAGLANWLLARETKPSVVIGYDGRTNSQIFATDTAEIMAGAGIRAIILPHLLPTPVLAFAVRHLEASAGVMVTASHNPATDNGYKVYLGGLDGGSQIIPPSDSEIEAAILGGAASAEAQDLPRSTAYETATDEVVDEYVRRSALGKSTLRPPLFVYTPLHGVGWDTAKRVFAEGGLGEPTVVPEQVKPDATFPTVRYPNPEEPGVLDLAIAKAKEVGADLVIANDPDADRLAIAVPADGSWRALSGNEIGALLGWRAAMRVDEEEGSRQARSPEPRSPSEASKRTLAASIVSSPALKEVARQYNLNYVETLTGFKWISRVEGLGFGFEEALGYLVDPYKVRDKDGISAAVDFLRLFAELTAAGTTLEQHQRAFDERFGAYASFQVSLRLADATEVGRRMTALRAERLSSIGSLPVQAVDDFVDGFEHLSPSNILRIWVGDAARVIVRPSGTEPKLKAYVDAWSTTGDGAERRIAANAAVLELTKGVNDLLGA
jgi:phosphomannomutase